MGLGGKIPGNIKSTEQFQIDLNNKRPGYIIIGKYIGNDKPLTVKHICGKQNTFARSAQFLAGSGACSCLHKKQNYRTLKSHDLEVKKWWGKEYECVEYNGSGSNKLNKYKHLVCKGIFEKTLPQLKATKYCPCCQQDKLKSPGKFTEQQTQAKLDKLFNKNEYTIAGKYKGTKVVSFIEHKCGHVYQTTVQNLFNEVRLCPKCCPNKARTRCVIIKGREYQIQGYENKTLEKLLKTHKHKDIFTSLSGKVPRFNYTFKNKECKYSPDFYIKSTNTIIEVKSLTTFGLLDEESLYFFGTDLLKRNQAKAKAVLKKGYNFKLHLWDKNKIIHLPSNWINMSLNKVKTHISIAKEGNN